MEETLPIFKSNTLNPGVKKRIWKSLKQIVILDKAEINYSSINPPPSFRPAKRYSDISGLIANYKCPHKQLLYANADEYNTVRSLPMDIISGYLLLRGATNSV